MPVDLVRAQQPEGRDHNYGPDSAFDKKLRDSHRHEILRELEQICPSEDDVRGEYLSKAQERFLSGLIQAGVEAETNYPHNTSMIEIGHQARVMLFEANLDFAYMFARASMGIVAESTMEKMRESGDKYGHSITGFSPGTYKPMVSLKSPNADAASRYSNAALGLWEATVKFKPVAKDGKEPAKFISFAAWSIQHSIERGIQREEFGGVKLTAAKHQTINQYFNKNQQADTDPVPRDISFSLNALEKIEIPGTAERTYGMPEDQDEQLELIVMLANQAIEEVLDQLSEREAGVVAMYFGLFDYRHPMSFDEIGKIFGVTRERIRQILSKAMSALRHPRRSLALRDYLDDFEENMSSAEFKQYGRHGDGAIVLGRVAARKHYDYDIPTKFQPAKTLQEVREGQEKEAWQAFAGEKWDAPIRNLRGEMVDSYTFSQIRDVLMRSQAYNFQDSFGKSVNTDFPVGLFKRIKELSGNRYLSNKQVDELEKYFYESVLPRLEEEIGEDLSAQRVVKLFTKLRTYA